MRFKLWSWALAMVITAVAPLVSFQDIRYGIGTWDEEKYGNHRVVIQAKEEADAVWVHVLWRRRDLHPEKKEAILIDAQTGKRVMNLFRAEIRQDHPSSRADI